jgi:hypothetical protein
LGRCIFLSLRETAWPSQVREKIKALRKRRIELVSAIDILARSAVALRAGSGGFASAFVGDSGAGAADAAVASGSVTLASVMLSMGQARRLREQFDRRWGFARERTPGAALKVCLGLCVCGTYFSSTSDVVKTAS